MGDEQNNVEVVKRLGELWNAGNLEGMLDLYDDEVEMVASPEWPDPGTVGKAAFARYSEEWREAWETVNIDLGTLEARGDTVLVTGAWDTRGAASGIDGSMPFLILFTLRDGLVTRHRWFMDQAQARAAAGL
jgi:ketosteroid isomerase-like protein